MTAGEIPPGHADALDVKARIDKELADLGKAICEHEAQICALRDRMCLLLAQRNSLFPPVSLLPTELLEAIFIHWARIHHDGVESTTDEAESVSDGAGSMTDGTESLSDGTESLSDGVEEQMDGVPMWVNASHVCRRWRDVALNCPTLWSYISPASQRWIQEMLSRSKTAPLKIRFEWTSMDSNALDVLKDLLAHTDRIQELRLDIPHYDVEKVFPMLSSPAPLLQSLEIVSCQPPNESYIIPLFNGVTPALHRLELVQCFIPRATLALGSLTTLLLSWLDPPIAPTPLQLHVLLSSMPNLAHLGLYRAFAPSRDELATRATCHSQNTELPHLLRLSIHEPLPEVIGFLTRLDIPSQTEVRIHAYGVVLKDRITFRTFLLPRLFTSRRCPPRSIAVGVRDGMTCIVFCGSENANHYLDSYSPNWDCGIPLKIKVTHPTGDQSDFVRDIMEGADGGGFLASVQSTSFTLMGNANEDWNTSHSLKDIFGLLPKLRYIKIIGAGAMLEDLFSSLSLTSHNRDQSPALDQPSGEWLTSALEELVIRDCIFRQVSHPGGVGNLCNTLAIRKMTGFPLNRLGLIRCGRVSKDDVAELQDVTAEVSWDGIEED